MVPRAAPPGRTGQLGGARLLLRSSPRPVRGSPAVDLRCPQSWRCGQLPCPQDAEEGRGQPQEAPYRSPRLPLIINVVSAQSPVGSPEPEAPGHMVLRCSFPEVKQSLSPLPPDPRDTNSGHCPRDEVCNSVSDAGSSGICMRERSSMPSALSRDLLPACLPGSTDAGRSRAASFASSAVSPHRVASTPGFGSMSPFPSMHTVLILTALAPGGRLCHARPRTLSSLCQLCHPFQHSAASDAIPQCTQPPLPPGQPESQGRGQAADYPVPCTCLPHRQGCIPVQGAACTACWQDWTLRGQFVGGPILHLV